MKRIGTCRRCNRVKLKLYYDNREAVCMKCLIAQIDEEIHILELRKKILEELSTENEDIENNTMKEIEGPEVKISEKCKCAMRKSDRAHCAIAKKARDIRFG